MANLIDVINQETLTKVKEKRKGTIPEFNPGDTIAVHVRVTEGSRERIQVFEGVVIAINKGSHAAVTVRKISSGVGVERVFPLNSLLVSKIDVKRRGRVRRAKLYYLRELTGKAARIKEKILPKGKTKSSS